MKRTYRYRPDGTSYELPPRRAQAPLTALFLGDKTVDRKKAREGLVRAEETPYVVQDLQRNRANELKAQKGDRVRAVVDAYKRHTGDL